MDIIFKSRFVIIDMDKEIRCPRCDNKMVDIQACHMFCPKCGAHLDCSDKGSFW
ncbi:MAG: hypothetical protein OEM21_01770 [Nitrosopumilus sp.]|nr:hypothetical protein [Nitrosopumilus sp.]